MCKDASCSCPDSGSETAGTKPACGKELRASPRSGFGNFLRGNVSRLVSFSILVPGAVFLHFSFPWFMQGKIALFWFLASYLPVAFPVAKEAWKAFARKDFFNEFSLMLIASIGAFFIGQYPEAVAVMLFYSIGEALQDRAVARSKRSIGNLLGSQVGQVQVWQEGAWRRMPPEQVEPGRKIQVAVGERVCLDGRLDSESAVLDTAALTGESVPREVGKGGSVPAGCVVIANSIELEVTKPYSDSTMARMARMVEEASRRKAPTEIFMRKVARVYTPVVMCLAVLILLLPAAFSGVGDFTYDFESWLYRALVFLVISCPCALVVSIPLSYFAGIGRCSRSGILFKGGNGLDAAAELDAMVFDKTGTLTEGNFVVDGIRAFPGFEPVEVLRWLASVENASRHPLAKAIVAHAEENGTGLVPVLQVREQAGMGVKAVVDGREIVAGSAVLMRKEGIALPALPETGSARVFCGVDGCCAGYVELADKVKPEAGAALEALRKMGVRTLAVLSGDSQEKAEAVAKALGLEEAFGDLLPENKVLHLQEFRRHGLKVAFAGDGINDAPVLAASNLGIAMGKFGSDAAIETADVVLQSDSLQALPRAVRLARETRKTVWQNIVMIFGFKLLIMVLGVLDMASLWAAVFADTGVALLAVLNSVRAMWGRNQGK